MLFVSIFSKGYIHLIMSGLSGTRFFHACPPRHDDEQHGPTVLTSSHVQNFLSFPVTKQNMKTITNDHNIGAFDHPLRHVGCC